MKYALYALPAKKFIFNGCNLTESLIIYHDGIIKEIRSELLVMKKKKFLVVAVC